MKTTGDGWLPAVSYFVATWIVWVVAVNLVAQLFAIVPLTTGLSDFLYIPYLVACILAEGAFGFWAGGTVAVRSRSGMVLSTALLTALVGTFPLVTTAGQGADVALTGFAVSWAPLIGLAVREASVRHLVGRRSAT